MKKLDIKEYSKKYREKNREKLRKIGLSHYYRRKKELEEIRKKYIDFQFIPCYWDNMKEEKVLLTFNHRSGDDEHDVYMLVSKKDSQKEDSELIKKAFWNIAKFDDSMDEYWISDTDVASVESKDDITEDEIKVLQKFGIVYE